MVVKPGCRRKEKLIMYAIKLKDGDYICNQIDGPKTHSFVRSKSIADAVDFTTAGAAMKAARSHGFQHGDYSLEMVPNHVAPETAMEILEEMDVCGFFSSNGTFGLEKRDRLADKLKALDAVAAAARKLVAAGCEVDKICAAMFELKEALEKVK